MRNLSTVAVILLAGALPTAANAQVGKVGGEIQVNTFTSGDQENARVATDATGNFIVVWTSRGGDGDDDGASVQRFNSTGSRLGTEFEANTYTTNDQDNPAVAVQPNGNFVVVWESHTQDGSSGGIFGQRFNSGGAQVGTEFQVNTFTSGDQENPLVAVDPAGNFVAVWEGNTQSDNHGIGGQRFNSSGAAVGTEFQINTATSDEQEKPAVAMDGVGDFVVVWESHYFDGDYEGVAAQRYDSTGAPVGTEFQVNTYTTNAQEHTGVAMDAAGNFVVVWDSFNQDGSAEGIFGQRFNTSGTPVGTEFQANTYTTSEQEDPAVALDTAGNFVVTWYSGNYGPGYTTVGQGQDGDEDGAFGQRFTSSGARLGTEFQINTFTTDYQTDPKVATQPGGNFVVAWQSENGYQDGSGDSIQAQRFGMVGQTAPALSPTNLMVLVLIFLVIGGASLARRQRRRA